MRVDDGEVATAVLAGLTGAGGPTRLANDGRGDSGSALMTTDGLGVGALGGCALFVADAEVGGGGGGVLGFLDEFPVDFDGALREAGALGGGLGSGSGSSSLISPSSRMEISAAVEGCADGGCSGIFGRSERGMIGILAGSGMGVGCEVEVEDGRPLDGLETALVATEGSSCP